MDPGRALARKTRRGSRSSPKGSPARSPRRSPRKSPHPYGSPRASAGLRRGKPSPLILTPARMRVDSDPHTPFPSERFSHVTYTTYYKGTTYTRYVIQEVPRSGEFQLDSPKSLIHQTTYKCLQLNPDGGKSWFTQIHSWMNDNSGNGTATTPGSPKRKLRSIEGLALGQLSPKRFSGVNAL